MGGNTNSKALESMSDFAWKLHTPICVSLLLIVDDFTLTNSSWMLVHFSDLMIRYQRTEVKYRYILIEPFANLLRTTSEFLMLAGTFQIVDRLQTFEVRSQLRLGLILVPVWACGLYYLSLRFALSITWLNIMDLGVISSVANAAYAFESAYEACYLCCAIGVLIYASDVNRRKHGIVGTENPRSNARLTEDRVSSF